jgi:hypothetical protein
VQRGDGHKSPANIARADRPCKDLTITQSRTPLSVSTSRSKGTTMAAVRALFLDQLQFLWRHTGGNNVAMDANKLINHTVASSTVVGIELIFLACCLA